MRSLTSLIGLLALLLAGPAMAAAVDTGHIKAELVAQTQGVAPGRTTYVALRQDIQKGWHTYWRNAGDSGEATTITWTLPAGWSAGSIVWPTPHRQPTGPLMNYGYTGDVLLPVAITAPASARAGETATLRAAVNFLVCEEICVPEEADLEIALAVTKGLAKPDPEWGAVVNRTLSAMPRTSGVTAAFAKVGDKVALGFTGAPLQGADVAGAYFFPFDGDVIEHAAPQVIERGRSGLTLTLTPGQAFADGSGPQALAGVLALEDGAFEIAAVRGPPPSDARGLGPPPPRAPKAAGLGLAQAALFALLGGMILNLMPCVFPILAMKAASLAGHAHDLSAARRQGLAFAAGVLATFLGLAGLMIALKSGGAAIGWGFQLQSPPVVAGLTLLMLAVALNLSGVFEVGQALQGAGSGFASRAGLTGAFFTGAMAVVVAAPCTAPFMAPALGWALTQDAAAALAVFAALGMGFAAPFLAASYAPGLLARLPSPGPWMVVLRKALAFPMYAAAAWLAWVLTVQAGDMGLARILAASLVLAFAGWLWGAAQTRRAEGGRAAWLSLLAAVLATLAVGGALLPAYRSADGAQASGEAVVPYEVWSPQRLADLRADGRPVLVNFTAAWCVTCQVNDRTALSTRAVAEALKSADAVYLKADWTRKDAVIEAELARYGRAGVPLYLVYDARGGEPAVLPQILTESLVVRALEHARRR